MVYFKIQDLIGRNCVEAYNEYMRIAGWLNTNIPAENWSLDYSYMLLINGVSIPQGIKFYDFPNAITFIRSTT